MLPAECDFILSSFFNIFERLLASILRRLAHEWEQVFVGCLLVLSLNLGALSLNQLALLALTRVWELFTTQLPYER